MDDDSANLIVAQMLFLQFDDPKADIHLYINSPGGSVTAGMGIYDTMQYITCDVATYCIGQAASMGAVLLAAGTKGKRNALPHSRVMIHQPLAGTEGTTTEILIHAKEFIRLKKRPERDPVRAHRAKRWRRSKATPIATSSCPRARRWSMESWITSSNAYLSRRSSPDRRPSEADGGKDKEPRT